MSDVSIRRLDGNFSGWDELLKLVQESFAFMEDRIDPPSSAVDLTTEVLRQKAGAETVFAAFAAETLAGCIFCRAETDGLYIGKLAVSPRYQGKGIGRQLLGATEELARQQGLSTLRLETRIELVENHAIFAAWGFGKTAEKAHPGFSRTTSIEMRKHLKHSA
jgi:ribosomal protein S18 acetylase RimI-like enzyme